MSAGRERSTVVVVVVATVIGRFLHKEIFIQCICDRTNRDVAKFQYVYVYDTNSM